MTCRGIGTTMSGWQFASAKLHRATFRHQGLPVAVEIIAGVLMTSNLLTCTYIIPTNTLVHSESISIKQVTR
jgi:hypothetical protein